MAVSLSCERDTVNKDFIDDSSVQNINGTWIVVSYEDYSKNSVTYKNDVDSWNGLDVVLKYMNDSMCGRNTTNSVFGHYHLADSSISVTSYGGSKVGQPEWGNMFSDNVFTLESFKVNSTQLRFYYNDNKNSVTLNRETSGIEPCGY